MRNANNTLRGLLPLILLLGLAFVLIAFAQALLSGRLDFPVSRETAALPTPQIETATELPSEAAETSPTVTPSIEPVTSPPMATERPPSTTLVPTLPSTPATATETPPATPSLPMESALPTSTPYPSPTQESVATRTPFPLMTPAVNPAGTIFYLVRLEDNSYTLNSLNMNASGEVTSSSSLTLPLSAEELGGAIYPSPNGEHLAWIYPVEIDYAGLILNVSTGDIEQRLTNIAAFFGWHPDNRHVLVENSPTSGLWLVDLQSDWDTPLDVRGGGKIHSAAISPDGRRVIYTIQEDTASPEEVWMVTDDGRDRRYLDWLSDGMFYSWSPDGEMILTYYMDGWALLDAQGSNPRQIAAFTSFAQCYPIAPHWSPGDIQLTIVSDEGNQPFCQGWSEAIFQGTNISLVDADTGFARPLLSSETSGNIDPAWSPDGSMLAFVSNRSGTAEIWVVNADGSNPRQLTNVNKYIRFPFWRRP
jgi:Tol biopolymer transport system component